MLRAFDYDRYAALYDAVELQGNGFVSCLNTKVAELLQSNCSIRTVLDFSCGTGSQVQFLNGLGYQISGVDLSADMLKHARRRCTGTEIRLQHGDMCSTKVGKFDAVISMFNAVGHLSPRDFERFLQNARDNLEPTGILIFDIFNWDYMIGGGFIPHWKIDSSGSSGTLRYVRMSKSRLLRRASVMRVKQKVLFAEGLGPIEEFRTEWDMQLHSAKKIGEALERTGFSAPEFHSPFSEAFSLQQTLSMIVKAGVKQ